MPQIALPTAMTALVWRNDALCVDASHPLPAFNPETEALVQVLLAGICNTDVELIKGYMGFNGILGHECVAKVLAAPARPELVGQRVCIDINASCGKAESLHQCSTCGHPHHCPTRSVMGIFNHDGCFATYVAMPLHTLLPVSETISNEAAVFVEPLAAGFEILEQRPLDPQERVLVQGDGKLGLLIAMALSTASKNVTLVGKHADKLALVADLGVATHCLADAPLPDAWMKQWDVVVEATGTAQGLESSLQLVRPRGTIVLKSTVATGASLNLSPIVIDELTVLGSRCGPFDVALKALETYRLPVERLITARYPLGEGVAAMAHAQQKGVLKVLLEPPVC